MRLAAYHVVKFSIIVPVFNTANHLNSCIAALHGQDIPPDDYEFLMVDNNSTDGSPALLAKAEGIRVLHEPKQGSYAARNCAIRQARGSVLAFTDSDCMPEPGWLRAIDAAFSAPCLQVVQGFRRPLKSIGCLKLLSEYEHLKDQFIFNSYLPDAYYGYTNNMAVRGEAFARYGPFMELPRGADTLFIQQVVKGEGCQAMTYSGSMAVVHAEMMNIMAYFRKMFIYGRSHQVRTLNISGRERLIAFQSAVSTRRSHWLAAILLFCILSCGMISWHIGRLGRLHTK